MEKPTESHDHACGCHVSPAFDGMEARYKGVLWIVIAVNAAMFLVEMGAGALAGSQALKADALDFLGDSATYGLSLLVIGRSLRVRAGAALLKAASLMAFALFVLAGTAAALLGGAPPRAEVMGGIGLLALAANVGSVLLLLRYRNGDANVRSVWLCSRNDAIGNVAVMLAGGAVFLLGAAWPDRLVAAAMAGLFLVSSISILRQALGEMGEARLAAPGR
ncbi:MAG: cation transporter [Alphaproteobacteria bacterium]|nr:cation transporter [Alphaproteobacteria bacterium]